MPAVSWAADDSKFIAQTGPTALQPAQSGTVSITMRNTGTTTWTAAAGYKLGSENPQDNVTWGKNRIQLAPGDAIRPGEEKTFTFTITAPSATGWYNLQWRMLKEGAAWFGDLSANRIVQVLAGWDLSEFVAQTGPASLQAGQSGTVSITMRNTGSTTWTATAGYKLGSENPQDNITWGKNRIQLAPGDTIKPGEEKTFTFSVTAPSATGWYNLQWRMLKEGVAWFGDLSANRIVQVLGAWDISEFVAQTGPASLQVGQSGTVSITMRNTGSTTWTATAGYKLGSENPRDNVTWGTNRIQLAPGEAIKPGEQKTFTFTVRAPSAAGSYNLQWRMLREGVAWFGAPSANRMVQVLASSGGGYRTDYEYACSWKKGATAGAASLRLKLSGPSGLQGTLTTAHANGAVEQKSIVLSNPSHPQPGATTWLYRQTDDNVRCELNLLDSGTELVWKNCSNGLYQQCVAITQDVRNALAAAECSCDSLTGMAWIDCKKPCVAASIDRAGEDFSAAAKAACKQDLVNFIKCGVILVRSGPGMEVCENDSEEVEELCWGWINFAMNELGGGSCSSSMECAGGSFCIMVPGGNSTCGSLRN